MAQIIPFDALLGASKTGLAIGATIYQLDGSTSYAAFSTAGWYEAPSGSGGWHHAGLSLPDAGGVVAVGIAATEYLRIAVGEAVLSTTQMQALADIILTRGSAGLDGIAALDSIYEAIGMLLRGDTSTGQLVVKKTDGVTVFNTRNVDTDPSAIPIVGIG